MDHTKGLTAAIWLNLFIVAIELAAGFWANSSALVADALHNASDVAALLLALIALRLQSRPASYRFTYGFAKAEALAGFLSALLLLVATAAVATEAVGKLLAPEQTDPKTMMAAGFGAFAINALAAAILHQAHSHHRHLAVEGAFWHMAADAGFSLAVAIAGLLTLVFKTPIFDPILTLLIAAAILYQGAVLLKKSALQLLDANSAPASFEELERQILGADRRIREFHDLHIHHPSPSQSHISFHLVLDDGSITLAEGEAILARIKRRLKELGFDHVVVQMESGCAGKEPFCIARMRAEAREGH